MSFENMLGFSVVSAFISMLFMIAILIGSVGFVEIAIERALWKKEPKQKPKKKKLAQMTPWEVVVACVCCFIIGWFAFFFCVEADVFYKKGSSHLNNVYCSSDKPCNFSAEGRDLVTNLSPSL